MSVSKINAPVSSTEYHGGYSGKDQGAEKLYKIGNIVFGVIDIEMNGDIPAGTWTNIGWFTNTGYLSLSIIVPCCDSWNGHYAGLLQIDSTDHTIKVFPIEQIAANHRLCAVVVYKA